MVQYGLNHFLISGTTLSHLPFSNTISIPPVITRPMASSKHCRCAHRDRSVAIIRPSWIHMSLGDVYESAREKGNVVVVGSVLTPFGPPLRLAIRIILSGKLFAGSATVRRPSEVVAPWPNRKSRRAF